MADGPPGAVLDAARLAGAATETATETATGTAARGWARAGAAGAAVAVPAGFGAMVVALAAGPGLWVPGYVSEAATAPLGGVYRAGLLVLALGVLLLAGSFAPLSRGVAGLLLSAALGAGASAAVPCSAGCPLPPYEAAGTADLVHTGASIAGMVACALAMLLLAVRPGVASAVRRAAAFGAALTIPLGLAEALAMLLAGRGAAAGGIERVLLCWVAAWLTGAAVLRLRGRSA